MWCDLFTDAPIKVRDVQGDTRRRDHTVCQSLESNLVDLLVGRVDSLLAILCHRHLQERFIVMKVELHEATCHAL